MSTPTAKQSIRSVIVKMFPWLKDVVAVAGAKGKGLAIRTASGLLHLAGGPDDPGVHRVGDAGTAGTITVANTSMPAPPGFIITWVMPDGQTYTIVVVGLVTATMTGPPPNLTGPILVTTQATTGSEKVTSA